MAKEQRHIDREAEEAFQQHIVDAVAARNAELAAGADPDRSNDAVPVSAADRMAKARAAKAAKK